jgi:hypothetical protein
MKNSINIKYVNQKYPYVVEYVKNASSIDGGNVIKKDIVSMSIDKGVVRLFHNDIKYYKRHNDWYNINTLTDTTNEYIPDTNIRTSNLKVYIPAHTPSSYLPNIKYAVSINTWINGVKIDLGSYIFAPTDTLAVHNGVYKKGNQEYYEYIDFDIIDPFYLLYSDEWAEFRKTICHEREYTNYDVSNLYVSLYVVTEYDNSFIVYENVIGGFTNFNIANNDNYLSVDLKTNLDPLGFMFNIRMNSVYDDLIEYLSETYGIKTTEENIKIDLVLKNKDSIIYDPCTAEKFNPNSIEFGCISQLMKWSDFDDTKVPKDDNDIKVRENVIKNFFKDWTFYEDGWNLIGSFTVFDNENNELLSVVSNELPITQELFSLFTHGGAEKIIDISKMEIKTYNVVNKIENKIVHLDRPNESKANIIQPVFFKVKDLELLTLHPAVTENISINLDNYKSKVERFTLKIGDCLFEQIGANSYGILFKIKANTLPAKTTYGTYYILDENNELVTTGKYNCVL